MTVVILVLLGLGLIALGLALKAASATLQAHNEILASHTRSLASVERSLRLRPMPMREPDVRDAIRLPDEVGQAIAEEHEARHRRR